MGPGRGVREGDASGWRAKEKETKEREKRERQKERGGIDQKRKGQGGVEGRRDTYGLSVCCFVCVCLCAICVWLALGTCECDMLVAILGCACEWMSVCLCVCWVVQDGATPAYIASWEGELKCLEVLIAAGADVNKAKKVRGGCTFSLLPFDPYHKDAKRNSKSKTSKVVRAEEEEGGGGGGKRKEEKFANRHREHRGKEG